MARYSVYESRGEDNWSYIGTVSAENIDGAWDRAHETFGAPIKVVEK